MHNGIFIIAHMTEKAKVFAKIFSTKGHFLSGCIGWGKGGVALEHWDSELEQRVWRRVRGQSGETGEIAELISLSRAQAADLKTVDRELFHLEQQTLSLLAGLQYLSGGRMPPAAAAQGNRHQRLARCRQRCGRMLQLMLALENHDRYGPVFTELTRQQRAKCARLEQLVSSQPGRRKGDSVTDFSPHRRRGADYPGW